MHQKTIEAILNEECLINQFSSSYACKIGYSRGKHVICNENLINDDKK